MRYEIGMSQEHIILVMFLCQLCVLVNSLGVHFCPQKPRGYYSRKKAFLPCLNCPLSCSNKGNLGLSQEEFHRFLFPYTLSLTLV